MFGVPRPVKRLFQRKTHPLRAFLAFYGKKVSERIGGWRFHRPPKIIFRPTPRAA
jgi:hypothetical protein